MWTRRLWCQEEVRKFFKILLSELHKFLQRVFLEKSWINSWKTSWKNFFSNFRRIFRCWKRAELMYSAPLLSWSSLSALSAPFRCKSNCCFHLSIFSRSFVKMITTSSLHILAHCTKQLWDALSFWWHFRISWDRHNCFISLSFLQQLFFSSKQASLTLPFLSETFHVRPLAAASEEVYWKLVRIHLNFLKQPLEKYHPRENHGGIHEELWISEMPLTVFKLFNGIFMWFFSPIEQNIIIRWKFAWFSSNHTIHYSIIVQLKAKTWT